MEGYAHLPGRTSGRISHACVCVYAGGRVGVYSWWWVLGFSRSSDFRSRLCGRRKRCIVERDKKARWLSNAPAVTRWPQRRIEISREGRSRKGTRFCGRRRRKRSARQDQGSVCVHAARQVHGADGRRQRGSFVEKKAVGENVSTRQGACLVQCDGLLRLKTSKTMEAIEGAAASASFLSPRLQRRTWNP